MIIIWGISSEVQNYTLKCIKISLTKILVEIYYNALYLNRNEAWI